MSLTCLSVSELEQRNCTGSSVLEPSQYVPTKPLEVIPVAKVLADGCPATSWCHGDWADETGWTTETRANLNCNLLASWFIVPASASCLRLHPLYYQVRQRTCIVPEDPLLHACAHVGITALILAMKKCMCWGNNGVWV